MENRFIVLDLDGCLSDDVEAAFSGRFLRRSGENVLGRMYREAIFVMASQFKAASEKLVNPLELDPKAVDFIRKVQGEGIIVRVETHNQSVDTDKIKETLAKVGVVNVEVVRVAHGAKGSSVNGITPLLAVVDEPTVGMEMASRGISTSLLRKSYNGNAGLVYSKINSRMERVIDYEEAFASVKRAASKSHT